MGRTELLIEYANLSRDFEFPEEIEKAVENDYVENQHLYNIDTIKLIAVYLLIYPDIDPKYLLELIKTL